MLIAGKGHETGQEVAGTVHPFDDREVAARAILTAGVTRQAWRWAAARAVRRHGRMRAVLLGGGIALLISLLGTRFAIRQFTRRLRPGDPQRRADDPPHQAWHADDGRRGDHRRQRGRLLLAKLITWTAPSASALLLIYLFVGLGSSASSTTSSRSQVRSLGLRSKAKLVGQGVVALSFGALALSPLLEDDSGRTPASLKVSFLREIEWLTLPMLLALLLIWFIVTGVATR